MRIALSNTGPPRLWYADMADGIFLNPTLRVKVTAIWNQRGVGARTMTIDPQRTPQLLRLARALAQATLGDSDAMDLDRDLHDKLVELGIIGDEARLPSGVAVSYDWPVRYVPLPDPNHVNFDPGVELTDLIVSDGCAIERGDALASRLHAEFVEPGDQVLTVRDAGTGITSLYRIPGSDHEGGFFARLLKFSGRPLRDAIAAGAVTREEVLHWGGQWQLLQRAHILVPVGYSVQHAAGWAKLCDGYRKELDRSKFVVLRKIFNPVQIALFREYYRAATAMGLLDYDDGQVEKRSVWPNEPVASYLHHQLVPLLDRIAPDDLQASYAYLAAYHEGAVLERHVDRPQCAWNLSVPLDSTPDTDETNAWPIYIEVDGEPHEVRLGLGDGVLYRGTDQYHWRNALPAMSTSTLCFFHFVDKTFAGSLK